MIRRTIENNASINMWGYSRLSPNFKFKEKINKTIDCTYGICNIFDTFVSTRDQQVYILFSNRIEMSININIYIYSVQNKEIHQKLTPNYHSKELRLLKYFTNKARKREYIISTDWDGLLSTWFYGQNNVFVLKYKINTYQTDIYSCLIVFKTDINIKINDDYLIFGCESISEDEQACTKIHSLVKGNFINNIPFTNREKIRNLLMWYNNKNQQNYLLCLGTDKILIINFLQNRKEKEIVTNEKNVYNCGIIYNEKIDEENEKYYLCCTSSTGHVLVFDLEEGTKTSDILLKPILHRVYDILPWNEKYFIVADTLDNGFDIFEFQIGGKIVVISYFGGLDEDDIECIRKINHPQYGECIVTASHKNNIKIFEHIATNFKISF